MIATSILLVYLFTILYFKNMYLILLYVFECFVWVYIWVLHVCIVRRSQNRTPDPMELELQNVVSYCVCARNQTQVPWKNSQCSLQLRHLSGPCGIFVIIVDCYH